MNRCDYLNIVFKGLDMTHKAVINGAEREVWRHMMRLWSMELITSRVA